MDFSELGSLLPFAFFCCLGGTKLAVFNEGNLYIFNTDMSQKELLYELYSK